MTLLEAQIKTGRTHQIRVQLAHLGFQRVVHSRAQPDTRQLVGLLLERGE
mgnify:CR=1 FL=1